MQMDMTPDTRNLQSLEEYTVFSLDRSGPGIEALVESATACGNALLAGQLSDAMGQLGLLVEHIRDFDLFVYNVCNLFNIPCTGITDANGSLEETVNRFRGILKDLGDHLEQSNWSALGNLLRDDLPASFLRLKALLPVLRNFISETYGIAA